MVRREKIILEGDDRASAAISRAEGGFKRFDDTLKKAATVGGMFFVAQALLKVSAQSIRAAVDAEEAGAAFETTFGQAAQRAGDYVEGMAHKAGMARYELQQLMAITGNVVQGLGATEDQSEALAERMVSLAADVASFSNAEGGAQAVLLALQSSINGEREALKTYGLALSEAEVQQRALSMTGKDHADQLTRLDKALATVDVAYDKANKAVGDLDRTQDSHANTLRRVRAVYEEAKVTLGQALLPVLDRLLPVLEDLAQPLAGLLVPAFQALGTAAAILAPPLQVVATVLDSIPALVLLVGAALVGTAVHFKTWGKLWYEARFQALRFTEGVKGISPAMVGAGTAIAGLTTLVSFYAGEKAKARAATKAFTDTLDDETGALTANTVAWVREGLAEAGLLDDLNALGVNAETVAQAMLGNADALQTLTDAGALADQSLGGLGMVLSRMLLPIGEQAQTTLRQLAADTALTAQQQGRGRQATVDLGAAHRAMTLSLQAAGREGLRLGNAIAAAAEQERLAKERADAAAEATRNLTAAMLANTDPVYAAADAAQRHQEALAEQARVLADPDHTAEEAARAQMDVARATLEAQAAADALDPRSLQLAMVAIADATGQPIDQVKELLRLLGILDTYGGVTRYYHPGGTNPGGTNPLIPEEAEGGVALNAGLARVGEHGPELIWQPKGAVVAPLDRLPSSTTVNATVHVDVRPTWPVSADEARRLARCIKAELDTLTDGEVHEWQRSR